MRWRIKMASIEVPKELLDKVYEVIEVAKTTGKVQKGTNETTKAIERGKAKFVVVAKDVTPPEIVMHIPLIAEEKEVPCFQVPSKEELGAAAGIDVGTGSVAVVQEGEAKNLIKGILTKIKQ
jgi:large subunit ribosomal protein L7Ae